MQGTEFDKRTEHKGPLPNADLPSDVLTAPGNFEKSSRVSLN
jgi:hypothetical protein